MKMTSYTPLVPLRTRATVANRDGKRCFICRSESRLQAHHITPRADGGKNAPRNLILVCNSCHDHIEGQPWVFVQEYRKQLREERSTKVVPSRQPNVVMAPGEHLAFDERDRSWKVWGTDSFGVYARSATVAR